jgi:ribonuclease P protein component
VRTAPALPGLTGPCDAQYPRTVARTLAIRLRPGRTGVRAGYQRNTKLSTIYRKHSGRLARRGLFVRIAAPNLMRRHSWPRASGHFSPTTGAERGCTGFGCGCGPGPDERSSQSAVARGVGRSPRELTTGIQAVLPARNRMRRSTDFDMTVKRGVRAAQPDVVVHARLRGAAPGGAATSPRVGFIVAKSVGSAVQRHRVTRRLRHVIGGLLTELPLSEDLVVRALPNSRVATSSTLEAQLRAALRRVHASQDSPTGAGL